MNHLFLTTLIFYAFGFFGFHIAPGQQSDHVSLALNFQPDSTLNINATYTLRSRTSDSVYFVLNPGLQISKLDAEGLTGNQMAMVPGRPFPYQLLTFKAESPSENLEIQFEYSINLKQMNHISSDWIELNVDKLWVPNANDLDNRYTFDANISGLYEGYSLVTYQIKEDVITPEVIMNPDGEIKLTSNEPGAEVFIMAGADMQLWESQNRKGKTKMFISKSTADSVLNVVGSRTDELIRFFNQTFKSNPIDNYLMVMRNTKPGEINFLQSRGSILLGNSFAGSYPSLSHEISHYWWSKADFINEPWMNESFANYSMLLALREFDPSGFEKQLARIEKGATEGGSILSTSNFDPNGMNTYYYKGAWLLYQLEQEIGQKAMTGLLTDRIKNKVDSSGSFLDLLELREGVKVRESFASKLE